MPFSPSSSWAQLNKTRAKDEMVTFIVESGLIKKRFKVHKDFACMHSRVLDRAFNGRFVEARTQTCTLDDVDPATFRLFPQYLYSQKVIFDCHNPDPRDDQSPADDDYHPETCKEEDINLIKLWILPEKMQVPQLQNQIIDQLDTVRHVCWGVGPDCWSYVYDNTSSDSPLRLYLADAISWSRDLEDDLDSMLYELLVDLVKNYRKAAPTHVHDRQWANLDSSGYYVEEA